MVVPQRDGYNRCGRPVDQHRATRRLLGRAGQDGRQGEGRGREGWRRPAQREAQNHRGSANPGERAPIAGRSRHRQNLAHRPRSPSVTAPVMVRPAIDHRAATPTIAGTMDHTKLNIADGLLLLANQHRKERAAVRDFVEGALACDGKRFGNAIDRLWGDGSNLRAAFRRIARESVPMEMRTRFARIWFDCGEHFRTEVGDDRVLADGLRALMPPYRGRLPVVLYREQLLELQAAHLRLVSVPLAHHSRATCPTSAEALQRWIGAAANDRTAECHHLFTDPVHRQHRTGISH